MNFEELYKLLEHNYSKYNNLDFIDSDPIQIPHRFVKKEDIEISAFLVSTIAWGRRDLIVRSGKRMMQLLDNSPYDFVMNATGKEIENLQNFVHRTFNGLDFIQFVLNLRNIYTYHKGLETVFNNGFRKHSNIKDSLIYFRKFFFEHNTYPHSLKHLSDVSKKASAKRLNLFLMWMVRKDDVGVHFGLWRKISKSELMLPLDLHTASMGRNLGLLQRKQNDWLAVEQITENLRKFDPIDPTKYDFALFGMDLEKN